MNNKEIVVYEPDLGLEGTIPELIDWASRYTTDYSDPALERISELAKEYGMEEKYIQIPLLLIGERKRETTSKDGVGTPYERMKIDWYLFKSISYSESNYQGNEGTELEIWNEGDCVLISLTGADDGGQWHAARSFSVAEFMAGEEQWIDVAIGNILYYSKMYEEE